MRFLSENTEHQSVIASPPKNHRGWAFLEQGSVALIVIFVIVVVLGGYYKLKGSVDLGNEAANIQNLITSTQNLMKGSDGYTFSSGDKMMGALIQIGGTPKGMTLHGTASSGTATVTNTWGGAVSLAPLASSGFTNGFTVTYEMVPQSQCIKISTQISKSGIANGITINSSSHDDGKVTIEDASSQCAADNGNNGTNTLIFTVNG